VAWGWVGAGSSAVPGVQAQDQALGERTDACAVSSKCAEAMTSSSLDDPDLGRTAGEREMTGEVEGWCTLAAVLATMPDVIDRISATHTPTRDGQWCTELNARLAVEEPRKRRGRA
jgi:hypothetical protein